MTRQCPFALYTFYNARGVSKNLLAAGRNRWPGGQKRGKIIFCPRKRNPLAGITPEEMPWGAPIMPNFNEIHYDAPMSYPWMDRP